MFGSNEARPFGRLGLLVALAVGITLAVPIPVLSFTDGQSAVAVWLDDGDTYVYSYVNSVYDAPVEERHVRAGDQLKVTSVRSTDVRAVEYFRWGDLVRRDDDDAYIATAPPNASGRLTIRVSPAYRQRFAGAHWTVDLAERFGDGVVLITPGREPILSALIGGWRP